MIALEPDDTLHERVQNLGSDFARFATKLSVSRPVSMAFAQQPPRTDLHILVGLPLRSKSPILYFIFFSVVVAHESDSYNKQCPWCLRLFIMFLVWTMNLKPKLTYPFPVSVSRQVMDIVDMSIRLPRILTSISR
jgi:hypothetical protein